MFDKFLIICTVKPPYNTTPYNMNFSSTSPFTIVKLQFPNLQLNTTWLFTLHQKSCCTWVWLYVDVNNNKTLNNLDFFWKSDANYAMFISSAYFSYIWKLKTILKYTLCFIRFVLVLFVVAEALSMFLVTPKKIEVNCSY